MRTIEALRPLAPAFVSVTRTGGKPREATVELATRIQGLGIEGAAHITCDRGDARDDIAALLELMAARGIENLVALRGDRAAGSRASARPATASATPPT